MTDPYPHWEPVQTIATLWHRTLYGVLSEDDDSSPRHSPGAARRVCEDAFERRSQAKSTLACIIVLSYNLHGRLSALGRGDARKDQMTSPHTGAVAGTRESAGAVTPASQAVRIAPMAVIDRSPQQRLLLEAVRGDDVGWTSEKLALIDDVDELLPTVFLRPGQELTSWVEGIGELRNPTAKPKRGPNEPHHCTPVYLHADL